ncbi:MAG: neutral/alkaline non-lysosomal ceramidase N-terminal domain-containing protein [Clostridia bacterium]
MKAAAGRINITPENGIPMGGNVRIDNKSRGVHDDLFCNILMIDDKNTETCLMGFDFVGLKYETCNEIKKKVSKTTGIAASNIMIWGTHTHSGPDTCMRMYHGIDEIIGEYLDETIAKVAEGAGEIQKNYIEADLRIGRKEVRDLSFNRRLVRKDGTVVMNFESFEADDIVGATGPTDPELLVLSVWNKRGGLHACLVNFTLHPAVLVGYKWLISRDFIHYLDEYMLDAYGRDTVVLFANGAEGNINHLNFNKADQWRDFRETRRIGRKLGRHAGECIESSHAIEGPILFESKTVALPLREITRQEMEWADMVLERDRDKVEDMFDGIPDKTYAKMIKGMLERPDKEFETVIQGMAVGELAIITFPGEVYVEFGLEVKKRSAFEYTMVIGLANSQSGYIPKEEAFSQGGYEVRTAWSSQLVYNAGDILVELVDGKILGPMANKKGRAK